MKSSRSSGMTRRNLLFTSAAMGLTLLLPRRRSQAAARGDERFLLHINVSGGLDPTMLFDARLLAMTAAGLIHNPLGEQPTQWTGSNDVRALTATTTAPLRPLADRFSVINGVVMSTTFDGHEQNLNLLLTGNPFGGASYQSVLHHATPRPLDYVRLGPVLATLADTRTVELTAAGLRELVGGTDALSDFSPAVDAFLEAETGRLGDQSTRFGAGALALSDATRASQELRTRIQRIELEDVDDPLDAQLGVIREVFRHGIAGGATLEMVQPGDQDFDTHAPDDAIGQGPMYLELCDRLARVLRYLANTAFDGERSLLDVTTVLIGSEFGRTMRQEGLPIEGTGTDHNPLSSTFLIGGAGIRTGLVVGASDFTTATETLSGAHLELDPYQIKIMGKPFDFTTGRPRADHPGAYAASDYLHVASVINTIYSLFGVERDAWRSLERNGAPAPVLSTLIA